MSNKSYDSQLAFVNLITVQLQLDSYTKTLDSVNFASSHSITSTVNLAISCFRSCMSMNKLFQLKYILLMIECILVGLHYCDKSQRLISINSLSSIIYGGD